MAITQAVTTSFKSELLQGIHNFHNGSGGGTTTTTGTGNTFKIALYTSSATTQPQMKFRERTTLREAIPLQMLILQLQERLHLQILQTQLGHQLRLLQTAH